MTEVIQLGDMTVTAKIGDIRMWKALAVIAETLHPAYEEAANNEFTSKDKCLFASLAVRDFLRGIGHKATVRGVGFFIRADDNNGNVLWSLGVGTPGQPDRDDALNGHVVCTVPALKILIDTTLYGAIRPYWQDTLSGMMVAPYYSSGLKVMDRQIIAGGNVKLADRTVEMIWLDRPEVPWRQSIDYRDTTGRRRLVTKAMLKLYGGFK